MALQTGRHCLLKPSAQCSDRIHQLRPIPCLLQIRIIHWLQGIEPFESDDELYLMKTYGDLHVILGY